LFSVGILEHIEYTNRVSEEAADLIAEMYEAMIEKDNDEVVRICDEILEILNTIKEYHTDETLL
jgi:hypothetical protein